MKLPATDGAPKPTSNHRGVVSDPWLPVRWPEYAPPKSAVSALAQMPSYLVDGYSLSDAYMRDCRAALSLSGDKP